MSLASVKSFVETIKEKHAKIDILMNNAGVMMCPFGLSSDGKNLSATVSSCLETDSL
jgi:NADP-dependent 3-hydroxy acid dehydrogenase YdfG